MDFNFNVEFRKRILASCLDEYVYAAFGTYIKPEYFELEKEIQACRAIEAFYKEYDRVPEEDELLEYYEWKSDEIDLILELYEIVDEGNIDFAIDKALQFIKEQSIKIALLDSVDDLNKGDTKTPIHRIEKAMEVGTNYLDLGLDFIEDVDLWLEELEVKIKIPTGIVHLDTKLDGGLSKGEVGIYLGPPNRRKSQALVNTGFGAMSMFSNSSVVHITCEISDIVVAKRYAARLVSYWFVKGRTDRDEYTHMLKDRASKLLKGNLIIKEFPSRSVTVYDIKAYLKQLKIAGYKFDVVIIDYLDELKHSGNGELRHQLRETVSELRALAHPTNMNVAIWTATQANRSSLSNEIITMEHISESFGKAEVADVVIALCQTKLEMQYDLMRLYGAKIRDGQSGFMVHCKVNEDAHAILSVSNEDYKTMIKKEKEHNVEADIMKHIAAITDQ